MGITIYDISMANRKSTHHLFTYPPYQFLVVLPLMGLELH